MSDKCVWYYFLGYLLVVGPERREYSVFDQALMDILLYTSCRLPEFVNFARIGVVHTWFAVTHVYGRKLAILSYMLFVFDAGQMVYW